MPPWTPEEVKQIEQLRQRVNVLEADLRELSSFKDRQRDQERHAWTQMLDSAKNILTKAFAGEVDALRPHLEKLEFYITTLDDIHAELMLARGKRIADDAAAAALKKKEEDDARFRKAIEAEEELRRVRLQAERDHRIKVWGVVIGVLTVVAGLLGTALASHYGVH